MVVFLVVVAVLALVAGGSVGSKAADMAPSAASDLRNGVLAVAAGAGLVLGLVAGLLLHSFLACLILTPLVAAGVSFVGMEIGKKICGQ